MKASPRVDRVKMINKSIRSLVLIIALFLLFVLLACSAKKYKLTIVLDDNVYKIIGRFKSH